ncbi:MAG TPA: carboxypeptidase regulatory-like domain-containing protein [Fibrobacteraceae bacterium]|nr:carboxypeptidase regulatory-like domain-containing protein [Fibrobacteraceae bacterium]
MRYRTAQVFLFLSCFSVWAGISWSVNSSEGTAEDTLHLILSTTSGWPDSIGLVYATACSSSVALPAVTPVLGLSIHPDSSASRFLWDVPPGILRGGVLCLAPYDPLGDSLLAEAQTVRRLSGQKHRILHVDSLMPWNVEWERPVKVPWSRLQVLERDSVGSSQERVLLDVFTRGDAFSLGELWMSPQLSHSLRLANAYDSSSSYTDASSWVVAQLSARYDTLSRPILRTPVQSAILYRSMLGGQLNFLWSRVNGATSYQWVLFRQSGNQWVQYLAETVQDSSLVLVPDRLPAGTWKWLVNARDLLGRRSQSEARRFSIDAGAPVHRFQVLADGVPTNGALVSVSLWGGSQTWSGSTGSLQGGAGLVALPCSSGSAEISVTLSGWPGLNQLSEIPEDTSERVTLSLSRASLGILRGRVLDERGRAQEGLRIGIQNADGDEGEAWSAEDGTWSLLAAAGLWQWTLFASDGLGLDSGDVTLTASQAWELGDLIWGGQIYLLQGRVQSSEGQSLSGAGVSVLNAQGDTTQHAVADSHGLYRLFVPEGSWRLSVSAEGYLPQGDSVEMKTARTQNFTLSAGSLLATGYVTEHEESSLGTSLSRPVSGAEIVAWDSASQFDSLYTTSQSAGDFRFSLPGSGTWYFIARSGNLCSSQQFARFTSDSGSTTLDLDLNLEARVEGEVVLAEASPDSILMLLESGGSEVARVYAYPTDTVGRWFYRFRNVSPGSFEVIARLAGFRMADTTTTTVVLQGSFLGRGTTTAADIVLQNSSSRLALFALWHSTADLPLAARCAFSLPLDTLVSTPDTLVLGQGRVLYNLIPDSSQWIPLYQREVILPDSGLVVDSVLFPGYHLKPKQLIPNGDTLRLTLELLSSVDSAFLWVDDSANGSLRKVSPAVESADSLMFVFEPALRTSVLHYGFELFVDSTRRHYRHPVGLAHYSVSVIWPAQPFSLALTEEDTLRVAVGTSLWLQASASTVDHADYAASLLDDGTVSWTVSSSIVSLSAGSSALGADLHVNAAGSSRVTLVAKRGMWADTVELVVLSVLADSVQGTMEIRERGGTSSFCAGDTLHFEAYVQDTAGYEWHVPASWETGPTGSSQWNGDSALVEASFIGPLWVEGQYGQQRDTLTLDIGAWISSSALASDWMYDSLVGLHIPDTAWNDGVSHRVGLYRWSGGASLSGTIEDADTLSGFFNLRLTGDSPVRTPQLLLRLPGDDRDYWPARLDTAEDSLHRVAEERDSVALLARVEEGGADTVSLDTLDINGDTWLRVALWRDLPSYYGMMAAVDSVRAAELRIVPNPFSPWVIATIDGNTEPGTQIRFTPYLPGKSSVVVRLEVLSLTGEPVRMLVRDQVLLTQAQTVVWGGATDSGHLVRNGRYLVLMTLRTSAHGKVQKKIARPVVVFK